MIVSVSVVGASSVDIVGCRLVCLGHAGACGGRSPANILNVDQERRSIEISISSQKSSDGVPNAIPIHLTGSPRRLWPWQYSPFVMFRY